MRILVTGATGVVGQRLLPQLRAAGHDVTAAVRTPERAVELSRAGIPARAADLFSPYDLATLMRGCDVVVNLATHIPPTPMAMFMPGAWHENDRIRRIASANLVFAALESGVRRFVQESFGLIYADHAHQWIDERMRVAPTRYNRSVLDAERSAAHFTASGGAGVVLRFAAFYGPDATQTQEMVKWLRKGWAMLPGVPDAYYSSVSHDDAARAVVAALGLEPGVYNVADDEPLMRRDYFVALAAALGLPQPRPMPGWMATMMGALGETLGRSQRISNRKLRSNSTWTPKYPSAREGLAAAVAQMSAPRAA